MKQQNKQPAIAQAKATIHAIATTHATTITTHTSATTFVATTPPHTATTPPATVATMANDMVDNLQVTVYTAPLL